MTTVVIKTVGVNNMVRDHNYHNTMNRQHYDSTINVEIEIVDPVIRFQDQLSSQDTVIQMICDSYLEQHGISLEKIKKLFPEEFV